MKYLVIDIGGTFTKYAIMDENCEFYKKSKVSTVCDETETFIEMIVNIYEDNKEDIEGIAISSAGIIDSKKGLMHTGGSLFCISNLNIVEALEKRCGIPVSVENDAKCAALAELWRGSLRGCRDAIVMILGTAVGGTIISEGKVLKGSHFIAGEFSYLFTDSKDALNPENTLAIRGGVPALIRLAAEIMQIPADELSGEKIFLLAREGNEKALSCIRKYAHILAVQVTNYQFMTDPERISIGGGISAQPMLLDMIREELVKLNNVYPHKVPMPEVTACHFFNDSNLIGALYVHLAQKESAHGKKI